MFNLGLSQFLGFSRVLPIRHPLRQTHSASIKARIKVSKVISFLPFTLYHTIQTFILVMFNLSSANLFSLVLSKILLFWKGLTLYHTIPNFNICEKRRKRFFHPSQNNVQFFSHIYFVIFKCFQFGLVSKIVVW